MGSSERWEKKKKPRCPARQHTRATREKKQVGRPANLGKIERDHPRIIAPKTTDPTAPIYTKGADRTLVSASLASPAASYPDQTSLAAPSATPMPCDTSSPSVAEQESGEPNMDGGSFAQASAYEDFADFNTSQCAQGYQQLADTAHSAATFSLNDQMIEAEVRDDGADDSPSPSTDTWLWRPQALDPLEGEISDAVIFDAATKPRKFRGVLRCSMLDLDGAAGLISQRLAVQDLGFQPYPNRRGTISVWLPFLNCYIESESHIATRVDVGSAGMPEPVILYVVPLLLDTVVLDRPIYVPSPSQRVDDTFGACGTGSAAAKATASSCLWNFDGNALGMFFADPATNSVGTARPPQPVWPEGPTGLVSTTAPEGWWVPQTGLMSLGAPAGPVDSGPIYFLQPTGGYPPSAQASAIDADCTTVFGDGNSAAVDSGSFKHLGLPDAENASMAYEYGEVPNGFVEFD